LSKQLDLARTYLQLPHNTLVEVFGPCVGPKRDQKAAIDVLLADASLSFLGSKYSFFLQLAGFPLRLGLPALFEGIVVRGPT
jgi:hypothetical protein